MPYRDDESALRERVSALERELERVRNEAQVLRTQRDSRPPSQPLRVKTASDVPLRQPDEPRALVRRIGERVTVLRGALALPATIVNAYTDGTYDLRYDDVEAGEVVRVHEANIEFPLTPAEQVDARRKALRRDIRSLRDACIISPEQSDEVRARLARLEAELKAIG